ncbi:nucleotidyl transferase AbiEii/AbiGii toxin family protein [Allohahella sp. A8]|uniref:nucleotidyl transferase AbiEii/AbiGii toxin family protein n=1 Tax=Allohahella sp. A8 TaxID=3141461 RepID=UPI003A7FECD7
MDKSSIYYRQVSLLLRLLPIVAEQTVFALKGGTAINLFIRNFPRLSVDIDLAYLPLEPRDAALLHARAALQQIVARTKAQPMLNASLHDNKLDELRVIVSSGDAVVKIEVSPVARGTLHEPITLSVVTAVEEEFGYAEIAVVSLPDLYGGKLCAALDRQHPRDLFDVYMLLRHEGITREIFTGFLTYALGHPRPIHELMAPRWKALTESYQDEFAGMTNTAVTQAQLEQTRTDMAAALQMHFTERDRNFLLSFKRGTPDWNLFDEPAAAQLPAVRWKLMNIEKLATNAVRHQQQIALLESVSDQWLSGDH